MMRPLFALSMALGGVLPSHGSIPLGTGTAPSAFEGEGRFAGSQLRNSDTLTLRGRLRGLATWRDDEARIDAGGWIEKEDRWGFEPLVSIEVQKDQWVFLLGSQQHSWGQSLALFGTDRVQPRDLRDPLLLDPGSQDLPQLGAHAKLLFSSSSIEFLWVPFPRGNKTPREGFEGDLFRQNQLPIRIQDPLQQDPDPVAKNFEWGVRWQATIAEGVDLSAFALRHFSRRAEYLIEVTPQGLLARPQSFQQESLGVGTAVDLNGWKEGLVFRWDAVYSPNDQRVLAGSLVEDASFDLVLGWDLVTGSDQKWMLSFFQSHRQSGAGSPIAYLSYGFSWAEYFETNLGILRGLRDADTWVRLDTEWKVTPAISLEARVDWIEADPTDTLGPLDPMDRWSLGLISRF